jgi:signal transduction histidine kinase
MKRVAFSLLTGIAVCLLTLIVWKSLQDYQAAQIARIAEAESYAARSQLIRNVNSMLRALRDVRDFWADYGHLPRDQWATDAAIEQAHFAGLEVLIWSDESRGTRYVRSADNPVLDYRPGDEEWAKYQQVLATAAQMTGEGMLGPFVDDDVDDDSGDGSEATAEIFIVTSTRDGNGRLVAVVDFRETFSQLLQDESPGYAITVLWGDEILYQRGDAAGDAPGIWVRDGMIETIMGVLWRVVHTPTPDLVRSLKTPAVTGILVTGIGIAVLVGLLTFENDRARSRALSSEVAERKLAELNQDLEKQIAERTSELALRSTDLETITDSVAHDLRNPLNSISVNVQLLQQQYRNVLDDVGWDALKRTSSGVRRMTDILNRLLGLSVVSHATFDPKPLQLQDVVRDVFNELSAAEQEPPVELVVEDLPTANADPTLVRTLIMNLLSNALKYTRDRETRRIEVRSETRNGVVIYSVRDNGPGFDRALRGQLFRAFRRLDNSGGIEGLGLGLDIAARVVRRHGGSIWADSTPGEGAIFCFTLEPGYDGPSEDQSTGSA